MNENHLLVPHAKSEGRACHAMKTGSYLGVLGGDLLEVVHSGADVVRAHKEGVEFLFIQSVYTCRGLYRIKPSPG